MKIFLRGVIEGSGQGWKLSLLISEDLALLCGLVVSRVSRGSLRISKFAVPARFLGQGFGKLLMDELINDAKLQGDVWEASLLSGSGEVRYYQCLGFKAFRDVQPRGGVKLAGGQVYLEKRLRQRPS